MTSDATITPTGDTPPPRSRRSLLVGLALALIGAAGGFGAVRLGLAERSGADSLPPPRASMAFVPLPALVVNLPGEGRRLLRFAAQLEVPPPHVTEVEALVPRVADVLNGYLRTLEPRELEPADALLRLRAQMLHRVQVVAGPGRVRDLLVMEFVLN